ncbi:hypothetical protein JOF36_001810 [Pseudonocardia parietis]|uniref:Uncharacterized protein n=1 Tax=Pseudonocardia parietis TaxID=570936 RepID=A0ABS4VRB5_9PSEU|nr:hypothetical protein [Pseudonocardia parietis]
MAEQAPRPAARVRRGSRRLRFACSGKGFVALVERAGQCLQFRITHDRSVTGGESRLFRMVAATGDAATHRWAAPGTQSRRGPLFVGSRNASSSITIPREVFRGRRPAQLVGSGPGWGTDSSPMQEASDAANASHDRRSWSAAFACRSLRSSTGDHPVSAPRQLPRQVSPLQRGSRSPAPGKTHDHALGGAASW